ncbi:aminotransferase class I/II-fold pyridoxal phosphate-dependent enzyme, partial [Fusicatenibacter saccharivorans]|nr:aminotransferase class I/II-fold pyridoxal phosphate-dependent enzyme [Fusicatenibacter saccharivorans]
RAVSGKGADAVLYTIPTNHNPTGVTMTNQHRHDLIDCCVANRLPIIEDNAYQDLYFGDEVPKPLKTMDETGMVITLGSASKSLAPGLRIGWIIANEPIVQRLADVKMQMDYGASL